MKSTFFFSDLENKYFILEALRVPCNLVQLYPEDNCSQGTWALRWHKENHPDRDNPTSEIRWYKARDDLDINELFSWTVSVVNKDRIPEVLVIDDEFSIVSYELKKIHSNFPVLSEHITLFGRFLIRGKLYFDTLTFKVAILPISNSLILDILLLSIIE